jgi:hypothetical protein
MADKEAAVKPKTVIAVATPTAPKPKTVVAAPALAKAPVLTPSSIPTSIQATPKFKVVTTNPAIGRAKY